ncbi:hypothetical protein CPB83DRAFT_904427 [Crepidotus variabilis]|uniref:Uncharacterized protein n=1 Tax=Crepidotus variabilis TaxID=179855 RepID=A0A9P6ENF2_9AGAR|nr:hypothetical protein CPB83DRAFT_904427 [Crepidotus variabilis]
MSAPTLETKVFRLEHLGKALEAKDLLLSFSVPSNNPTQLWSSYPGVSGQWIVNRGTGAYLVVDNNSSTVGVKIEVPYEWKIQNDGSSVRLETAFQKIFLQSSQQKPTVSPLCDADSLFNITYVAQPSLSIGSENYLQSPEHTCVANHVFNTVNALNAVIHILEHPDSTLPVESMAVLFNGHINLFRARGNEATQNLEFAKQTVASWFTVIGAKIDAEVKNKGTTESSIRDENPGLKADEKKLAELRTTHIKTETDLEAEKKKFKTAEDEYESAKKHFDNAKANEILAEGNFNHALENVGGDPGEPDPSTFVGTVWAAKKTECEGAEEKEISRKGELEHQRGLVKTLEDQSSGERKEIATLESDIKKAKTAIEDGSGKITDYQNHHKTLTTLHGLLKDCREHLIDTLRYKVGGDAKFSAVREKLKGLINILEKGEDFKEPLKILDRAALDHLMTRIPAITGGSPAGKLST